MKNQLNHFLLSNFTVSCLTFLQVSFSSLIFNIYIHLPVWFHHISAVSCDSASVTQTLIPEFSLLTTCRTSVDSDWLSRTACRGESLCVSYRAWVAASTLWCIALWDSSIMTRSHAAGWTLSFNLVSSAEGTVCVNLNGAGVLPQG